jgi:uncharacterized membrane protein
LTVLLLAITGRYDRLWRFCLCLTGSGLACALLACLMPAIGPFTALGLPRSTLELLPTGAGTYHLEAFEAYRTASVRTIDVTQLEGVVTFPSFHMAMALAIAYAYRGSPTWNWIAYGWNGRRIAGPGL